MQTKQKQFLFLFIAFLLVNIFILNVKCNPDWLSGWSYRKSHVTNSASGAGINYQVRIVVHYGSGTDSGADVYLNSHCRTDFGDVRFTKSDGTTLLDYWMESKVDSDNAVFWVEVADDLSTNPATIYIYYGKSDATTTSNGANTFLFFDDFDADLSKWTVQVGTWQIVSYDGCSCLKGSSCSDYYGIRTATYQASGNVAIRVKTQCYSGDDSTHGEVDVFLRFQDSNNFAFEWVGSPNRQISYLYDKDAGSYTLRAGSSFYEPFQTWYKKEVRFWGTSVRLYVDDVLKLSSDSMTGARTSNYLGLSSYLSTDYFDWILVRKYVDPEPSHGSWGSEETAPSGQEYSFTLTEIVKPTSTLNIQQEHAYTFTGTIIQSSILEYGVEARQILTQIITPTETATIWQELSYALTETAKPTTSLSYGSEEIFTLTQTIKPQTILTYVAELAEVFITNIETITLQETIQYWIQRVELPINWGLVALCASILAFSLASAAIASQKTSESD